MTPFPDIAFINEESTGCINQEATDAINEPGIGVIVAPIFISCFTVSVAPSINRPDLSSDSLILMKYSISSFEINKVNPFPFLRVPYPLIFFQIYLIQVKLL